MTLELTLALLVFFGTHSGPAMPAMRTWLVDHLGRVPYLISYSALSVVTVMWLILAKMRAPYIELWAPERWHYGLTLVAMLLACILFVMVLIAPNPLSIGRQAIDERKPLSGLLAVTRHPLLWSLALWAGSHLLANGDAASAILFGPLTAFCIVFMKIIDKRRKQQLGPEAWTMLSSPTSLVFFEAIVRGRARLSVNGEAALSIAGGLILFGLMLILHDDAFGVGPLWLWNF